MNHNEILNDDISIPTLTSKLSGNQEDHVLKQVPIQLHSAQQEINNLRLLNICLQSTLIRVQTQLIEYLPVNTHDEIKRHETKQKLVLLRHTDDHNRRIIHPQQISFFQLINNFKSILDSKQEKTPNREISLAKCEKQVDVLHDMFHELNTIIHTEHNDRICQLYITLAEASQSVVEARDSEVNFPLNSFQYKTDCFLVLDQTIYAHKIITRRKIKRTIFYILIAFTFISLFIFIIIMSIRMH